MIKIIIIWSLSTVWVKDKLIRIVLMLKLFIKDTCQIKEMKIMKNNQQTLTFLKEYKYWNLNINNRLKELKKIMKLKLQECVKSMKKEINYIEILRDSLCSLWTHSLTKIEAKTIVYQEPARIKLFLKIIQLKC